MKSEDIFLIYIVLAQVLAVCFIVCLLVGCSYSITMVHTQGYADDVVDEEQTPTSDIQATIPLK